METSLQTQTIPDVVLRALEEDVGSGDVTTDATVPPDARARAVITQKAPGVIFGLDVAEQVFRALDADLQFERLTDEGVWREGGPGPGRSALQLPVLRIEGSARAILTGERAALNFLQRLSGVATMAARAVRAVEGTGATILDTRKTTPGLRALEKAAVAAGGATNHRAGLYDAVLIKENHAALAGGVREAVRRAREAVRTRDGAGAAVTRPREAMGKGRARGATPSEPAAAHDPLAIATAELPVEVEARTLDEVDAALEAGANRILLDNMTPDQLRAAVSRVEGRAELEASGGVTLDTLREIASTGVQFVSVGALTHSAPALDLSLTLQPLP